MKNTGQFRGRLLVACACWGATVGAVLAGDAKTSQEQQAIAQLQQQNAALQKRLDSLENKMTDEGMKPGDGKDEIAAPPSVSAASATILSGYVQTSYFDNLENPSGGQNAGYLWNTRNNNFSINKVKLTLASPPVKVNGDKWDAGYRLSLIAGEDAPILNSNSATTGFDYLREAYVEFNIPVGNGIDVRAGEMISLLNYESGDGGAANDNFSQGYQWYYTGDGPETGLQASYALTPWLTIVGRIEDGLYGGAFASRDEKGFMGSLNFTPSSNSWINLLGFGGQAIGNEEASGGEILAGYQVTKKLHLGFEGDFFHLNDDSGQAGDLWSVGLFTNYAFTKELSLAFRAEYLDDPNGAGLNVASFQGSTLAPPLRGGTSAIASPDQSGDLASFTLTLNWMPTPNLKIQPEVRVNTTSYNAGFDGKSQQIIAGAGVSYLY